MQAAARLSEFLEAIIIVGVIITILNVFVRSLLRRAQWATRFWLQSRHCQWSVSFPSTPLCFIKATTGGWAHASKS